MGRYCILIVKDEAGITPDASSVIIYLMTNIHIVFSRAVLSHTFAFSVCAASQVNAEKSEGE